MGSIGAEQGAGGSGAGGHMAQHRHSSRSTTCHPWGHRGVGTAAPSSASRAAPSSPARSPPVGKGCEGWGGRWGPRHGSSPSPGTHLQRLALGPLLAHLQPHVLQVPPATRRGRLSRDHTGQRAGPPPPPAPQHPHPTPSPLTGAGLASGPRGCAGTGPQPSGPPGPASPPAAVPLAPPCSMAERAPAPRRGEGRRPRRGDPPHSPGRGWGAAGWVPGGAWQWGGSAWPW